MEFINEDQHEKNIYQIHTAVCIHKYILCNLRDRQSQWDGEIDRSDWRVRCLKEAASVWCGHAAVDVGCVEKRRTRARWLVCAGRAGEECVF